MIKCFKQKRPVKGLIRNGGDAGTRTPVFPVQQ